ncbi:MAG: hypothetical protein DRJ03_12570 [Chloroflexi bacterium]|nr:MAG: hypothetical protein DRJ03_12570 [Chloroflexota bacterium]
MLFVLFGLPAKIIYRGPGAGPQSVDHLEYYPTNRDFVFLRNFKRLLPKLSSSETIDKLIDLVKAFYGEEKAEKVRKYLESWGFFTIAVHDFLSQGNRVVVV